ncbi:MAG TPA: phage major capsid protein [Salinimicrobium sp.]|nr:phage major capsid protein [Salinimicrobium sp.]
MKKLAELMQERAAKIKAQSDLLAEVRSSEKKEFTEDQQTRFDGMTAEIKELDTQIERAKEIDAAEKRAAELNGKPIDQPRQRKEGGEDAERRAILGQASITRAMRMASKGKILDGAEKEMSEIGMEENRNAEVKETGEADFYIPTSMLRADAYTATEDAGAYGGDLIVKQPPRVQMPFAAKPVLESLGATVWDNLTGGGIPLPVMGKHTFEWLSETGETTIEKAGIDGPVLDPYRLGRTTDISNRLILQTSFGVEGYVRSEIIKAFNRAIDSAGINGSGAANNPTGLLNTAGISLSAIATAAAIPTRPMLNELPGLLALDDVDENNLAYLLGPALRTLLQDIKVDAGSGRFLMEGRNELNSYKAAVSTLVPDLAANHPLIFGDFSKLFIGKWGALSVLTDPYSASRKNCLRLTVNGHAGVAIAQPEAFAVNKFLNAEAAA